MNLQKLVMKLKPKDISKTILYKYWINIRFGLI